VTHTPTPEAGLPAGRDQAGVPPAVTGYLTEVPVAAGILRATAEILELLGDFFTGTDPTVRTQLGRFVNGREPDEDTGDPVMEAAIILHELTETADLLHTLAGDPNTLDETTA
jgi:hypothetical protein